MIVKDPSNLKRSTGFVLKCLDAVNVIQEIGLSVARDR